MALFLRPLSWFVYIIHSQSHNIYYKGETEDPAARIRAHNLGLSEYTKQKGPWQPLYIERVEDRRAALKREKQLKKLKHRSIVKLIESPQNIIKEYFI